MKNTDIQNQDVDSMKFYDVRENERFESGDYGNDWNQADNLMYYQHQEIENNYPEHLGYDQVDYNIQNNHNYQMNPSIIPNNTYSAFTSNHSGFSVKKTLFHNSSSSSIGNTDNFSHSEEGELPEGFNRTQSVRLYPNKINSCAMTSRLNSSYESGGILDEEEAKHSSRSYLSSGSKGSNPDFAST